LKVNRHGSVFVRAIEWKSSGENKKAVNDFAASNRVGETRVVVEPTVAEPVAVAIPTAATLVVAKPTSLWEKLKTKLRNYWQGITAAILGIFGRRSGVR
jgi:hypothetical protein